jgi:hypothetical protein
MYIPLLFGISPVLISGRQQHVDTTQSLFANETNDQVIQVIIIHSLVNKLCELIKMFHLVKMSWGKEWNEFVFILL